MALLRRSLASSLDIASKNWRKRGARPADLSCRSDDTLARIAIRPRGCGSESCVRGMEIRRAEFRSAERRSFFCRSQDRQPSAAGNAWPAWRQCGPAQVGSAQLARASARSPPEGNVSNQLSADRCATSPVSRTSRNSRRQPGEGCLSCRAESRYLSLFLVSRVRDSSTSVGMTEKPRVGTRAARLHSTVCASNLSKDDLE